MPQNDGSLATVLLQNGFSAAAATAIDKAIADAGVGGDGQAAAGGTPAQKLSKQRVKTAIAEAGSLVGFQKSWNPLAPEYMIDPPLWVSGGPITMSNTTFRTSAGRIYHIALVNGTRTSVNPAFSTGTAVFGTTEPTHTNSNFVVDSNNNQIAYIPNPVKLPVDADTPVAFIPGQSAATVGQVFTHQQVNNVPTGPLTTNFNWGSAPGKWDGSNGNISILGGIGTQAGAIGGRSFQHIRFRSNTRYVRVIGGGGSPGSVVCLINGKAVYPGPIFSDTYTGATNFNGVLLNGFELQMADAVTRNFEFLIMNINPCRINTIAIDTGATIAPLNDYGPADHQPLAMASFGSSYEAGANGAIHQATWVDQVAFRVGAKIYDKFAVGGCGFVNNSGTGLNVTEQIQRNGAANKFSTRPYDLVVLAGLINDPNDYTQVYNGVVSAWQAARAQASMANSLIVFTGGLSPGLSDMSIMLNKELAMRDAVSFIGSQDGNIAFVPVQTASPRWITGTGTTSAPQNNGTADFIIGGLLGEGTHPCAQGHDYFAQKWLRTVAAAL